MIIKKLIAVTTAITVVAGTILNTIPASSNNKEVEETKSEYVVMARNDIGYDKVEDNYNIVDDSESLENNNMIVAKMTESEAKKLENDKNILLVEEDISFDACVEKDIIVEKNNDQKDNLRDLQWNLDAIHVVNSDERENDKIKIALLDSGVDYDDDLNIVDRICMNNNMCEVNILFDDATGHGTAMAGIIGAKDNGQGIVGVNPNAQIVSVKILDDNNQTTLSQVVAGIYYAIENECDIINMSFGTTVDSEILHKAIREAYDKGILLIAAAGNNEGKPVEYPAAYDEVMAVGATDTSGEKLVNTNDGSEIEILAPGSQILTMGTLGGFIVTEGTSIATAHVSGVASLIWSMDKNKSADYVRKLLLATAKNANMTGVSNAGIIDVENAIEYNKKFKKIYQENTIKYEQVENRDAKKYEGLKIVNGSWAVSKHKEAISLAVSNMDKEIGENYVKLMKKAAELADYKNDDGNIEDDEFGYVKKLHGQYNYVKSLKFLYVCARYLAKNESETSKASIDEAIKYAIKYAKLDTQNTEDKQLVDAVIVLLNKDILKDVKESTNKARAYKVLGFAMHLIGDIFAHRTIVPSYTVSTDISEMPKEKRKSTSKKSYDAMFGKNDFNYDKQHDVENGTILKNWAKNPKSSKICRDLNCFVESVKLGVIEFKDIRYYTKDAKKRGYEDDCYFCMERYEDAKLACEQLLYYFENKITYDAYDVLVPTMKNVKLNGFKTYLESLGIDTSFNSNPEWKKISTLVEV